MSRSLSKILESIQEERARKLNLTFSTLAGLIYLYLLLNLRLLPPNILVATAAAAVVLDFSTVYFVHSGVLAGTLERVMNEKQASRFMKLHLWPGLTGYLFLLAFLTSVYLQPVYILYYLFLTGWLVMYISGLYAYMRLSGSSGV